MQISQVVIRNFRSIRESTISLQNVTAILGSNNAGKSTILRALKMFFEAAPKVTSDDYHNREADEIEITIRFERVTPQERVEYGSAVVDDSVTISRVFSAEKEANFQYAVLAMANRSFAELRAETNGTKRRSLYSALAKEYEDLPSGLVSDQMEEALREWEKKHPESLEITKIRGFFGAPNVANGKLRRKTALHLIPAVADAHQEASDPRKSPILQLLTDIARQVFENKKKVESFIEDANKKFLELVDVSRISELAGVSNSLTDSVRQYYQDSRLIAEWQPPDGLAVSFPQPSIKIEDQGFLTDLANVGHGLQRASLFAIIQVLAERASGEEGDFSEAQSDIILLIEEPEIYQHPHKQQVICGALHKICDGFSASTGIRFQVVFTTHSEKFVGVHRFQSARILRRYNADEGDSHRGSALSIRECSEYFAKLTGRRPMPDSAFEGSLHIFSREVCEGFFAEKIILVEGISDRAIIEAVFATLGRDALSEGIVTVSVDGKTKLDKPLYIFNKLGIPSYVIFNSDENSKDKKVDVNHRIQRILGIAEPIDFPNGCFNGFCALQDNLEAYLKSVIGGAEYIKISQEIGNEFELREGEIFKTPFAVAQLAARAKAAGKTFGLLEDAIHAVDHLEPWPLTPAASSP